MARQTDLAGPAVRVALIATLRQLLLQARQGAVDVATMDVDESMDKEDLIVRADKALYRAKAAGRNCCRIYGQDAAVIRFPAKRLAIGMG